MQSVVLHGVKDLRIESFPEPSPEAGQVKLRFGAGGICGSDLSYYFKGGVGDFMVKQPITLGHEVSGEIVELGAGVTNVKVGDRVAVNPNHPCGVCRQCVNGHRNICREMQFFGSAAKLPHIQGVFQEILIIEAGQCHVVPNTVSFEEAAMAEPTAVALHAVRQAGPLLGRHVLVTGVGPIGSLIMMAAKRAGAATVTVTDVSDKGLQRAREMGADVTVNVLKDNNTVKGWYEDKGCFDVSLEASGQMSAVETCILATKPMGRMVQVGMPGKGAEAVIPLNKLMAKELVLTGAFRFHEEFGWAVNEIATGGINVKPLLTHQFSVKDADEAFRVAADRDKSMKVHLTI